MKRNDSPDGLGTAWTDATEGLDPDPWCTSPDPEPAPDPIVVQAFTEEEK